MRQSLKRKWDWESALSTARRDGLEQGREEGRIEERAKFEAERRTFAAKLKQMGIFVPEIMGLTGLTEEVIRQL